MLSNFACSQIADLIEIVAEGESQIEILRECLCEKNNFESYTAFQVISKLDSKIRENHLWNFLQKTNSKIDEQDVHNLFRLFDVDRDHKLSYVEFLNIILPKKNSYLRQKVATRKINYLNKCENLPYEIELGLTKILQKELEYFHKCEKIRNSLALCDNFSHIEAFREIDIENKGYITLSNVKGFFERLSRYNEDSVFQAFINRADKDEDQVIKFSEFLHIFSSKEANYLEDHHPRDNFQPQPEEYIKNLKKTYSPLREKSHSPVRAKYYTNSFSPVSTKASPTQLDDFSTPVKTFKVSPFDTEAYSPERNLSTITFKPFNLSPSKSSPVQRKEKGELANALEQIITDIHKLEDVKNELALRKDFNLYNAFAIFDTEKKSYIDKKELIRGLKRLNIGVTKDELYLLMKRLDPDVDGRIRFGDFTQVASPRSDKFSKKITSRLPSFVNGLNDPLKAFEAETILSLRNFFHTLIDTEVSFESIRQRLDTKSGNLPEFFKLIDGQDNNILNDSQFRHFLSQNGIYVQPEEGKMLVERFTKSAKKEISYVDFVKTMSPKSPKKYSDFTF